MEYKEYVTVDRTGWPEGQWQGEPDKVQWQDEETQLPCLAVRNPHSGAWCGYVGISKQHALYGVNYQNAPNFEVHGGLTFSNFCSPEESEESRICHIPSPGEPDHVWWFGFDCNHCDDFAPGYRMMSFRSGTYRTLSYVKAECRSLAKQLIAYITPA